MTPLEALHNLVFNMLPDVWDFPGQSGSLLDHVTEIEGVA